MCGLLKSRCGAFWGGGEDLSVGWTGGVSRSPRNLACFSPQYIPVALLLLPCTARQHSRQLISSPPPCREKAEDEAWALRRATLRAAASGLLAAVDFCHSADVVHG